jgi:hypothetical protein
MLHETATSDLPAAAGGLLAGSFDFAAVHAAFSALAAETAAEIASPPPAELVVLDALPDDVLPDDPLDELELEPQPAANAATASTSASANVLDPLIPLLL